MTTHPTIAAGRFLFGLAMALLMICSGADAALPDAAFASTTPADAPTTTAPEVRQALENTLTDRKPAGYSYDDGLLLAELEKSVPIADLASLTQPRVSFQGLWHDPTTGLAYARNRWYDARTASWLSEDPKGPVDSPNLYAFVAWGPHVGRDPMGQECLGFIGDESLSCSETLFVAEGFVYRAYRQAREVRTDPNSSVWERGVFAGLQALSYPLAMAEEYGGRAFLNTPHRFVNQAEKGNEAVNTGDVGDAIGHYTMSFLEAGVAFIPASSEMRVVSAQAPNVFRGWLSAGRRWVQRNITGSPDEFSLAVRQGARGFSAEIGHSSPNHFSLGLVDEADHVAPIDYGLRRPSGVSAAEWEKKMHALNRGAAEGRAL